MTCPPHILTFKTCAQLNQRYHYHFPHDERYVAEIERSLLNVGIANQAARVGASFSGVRSFALLHGAKNVMQNISTCCEGQGTRLHNSLPEYVFSLIVGAKAAARPGGGAPRGEEAYAGVSVDIYTTANITFTVAGSDETVVTVGVRSTFPYFTSPATSVTVLFPGPGPGPGPDAPRGSGIAFKLALRIPSWVSTDTVPIALNGVGGFAIGKPGSYVSFSREWRSGDTLTLELLPALRSVRYVGLNQVAGTTRWAYLLGPVLLASRPTTPAA